MKKLIPLADRLLVRPKPIPTQRGDIYVPPNDKDKANTGHIVAFGPDVKDQGLRKVGAEIMYAKHAGTPVESEGESVISMRESECWFIIQDPIIPPTNL